MATECEQGFHEDLVASEPVEDEGSVNINHTCSVCGVVVMTESWAIEAWREHRLKEAERMEQRAAKATRKTRPEKARG